MAAQALRSTVQKVLSDRMFTGQQIEKLLPKIHEKYNQNPDQLGEIIDKWNTLFRAGKPDSEGQRMEYENRSGIVMIPMVASPPKKSLMSQFKINMNTILSEVEPDLLLFDPDKLEQRFDMIDGTGLFNNHGEHWVALFNAPRGFYLQEWSELTKKIYYLEYKVLELLYDSKERKAMDVHPIVKCAATTQVEFDHIRLRYLFALRSGYKTLSHLYEIQTASTRPTLTDIILSDGSTYLKKFAPYCTTEEYSSFANLIKHHDIDDDDSDVYEKLAELESLNVRQSERPKFKQSAKKM